jgi:hypothetical protein
MLGLLFDDIDNFKRTILKFNFNKPLIFIKIANNIKC